VVTHEMTLTSQAEGRIVSSGGGEVMNSVELWKTG